MPILIILFGFLVNDSLITPAALEKKINIKAIGTLKARHKSSIASLPNNKNNFYISIDLCDGNEKQFDTALFNFLAINNIPALIFVTNIWFKKNKKHISFILKNQNFSVQCHGEKHLVPSFQRKDVFNVPCVKNNKELINEIYKSYKKVLELTQKKPLFYRPATLFHDSLTMQVCYHLGLQIMVATHTSYNGVFENRNTQLIAKAIVKKLKSGDIILFHGNHIAWDEKNVLLQIISLANQKGLCVGNVFDSNAAY